MSVGESQISYEVTYGESNDQNKLINKIEGIEIIEQTDSDQRGGWKGKIVERRGREQSKNMCE